MVTIRPTLQFDILHRVTYVTDLRRHRCDLAGCGKLPPATLATATAEARQNDGGSR